MIYFTLFNEGDILKLYSLGEEIANSITHGIGALLAIVGLVIMIIFAALFGSILQIVSVSVYGGTLVLLYTMSTLYHAISNEKCKKILRILDHSSIYLLIAGTYTPFTLITLREASNTLGWSIFILIWLMSLIGIILSIFFTGKLKILSTIAYILMGWLIVLVMPDLVNIMKAENHMMGIYLLIAGGIAYTGGAVFYILKKKYFHSIWHGFVLIGSVLHFFSVFFYVM